MRYFSFNSPFGPMLSGKNTPTRYRLTPLVYRDPLQRQPIKDRKTNAPVARFVLFYGCFSAIAAT
jgi:hypothetical protein